jgi:hypothetical protein
VSGLYKVLSYCRKASSWANEAKDEMESTVKREKLHKARQRVRSDIGFLRDDRKLLFRADKRKAKENIVFRVKGVALTKQFAGFFF